MKERKDGSKIVLEEYRKEGNIFNSNCCLKSLKS